MDLTPIIVAAIGGGSVVAAAWLPSRKTRKAVEAVHTEVKTNHGKSAYQYLEMVADVKEMVESNRQDQAEIVQLIADHTAQDASNFDELRRQLRSIHHKVTPAP